MLRLIKPTNKYKKDFIAAMREEKNPNVKKIADDFAGFIKKNQEYERGKNLPKGFVSASYFWLMDGPRFIGETTIRHKLNKALLSEGGNIGYGIRPTKRKRGYGTKILTLALRKAKKIGIKRALVTCDDSNIGSWKIIEANNGVLQDKIHYKGKLKRRYWINIK